MKKQRLRISIKGQVQGVGFRPQVYRIASQLGLAGWVCNDSAGVRIEIQGEESDDFITMLTNNLPSLARIDEIKSTRIPYRDSENNFKIIESKIGQVSAKISPDVGICQNCLHELFNPNSRFYLYPFLNCTDCGPRFTITHQLPYDRENTAMANFKLCHECKNDYNDYEGRRYHAQPTACAICGPQISSPINLIADAINTGQIIALKGLGGYQLICDGKNEFIIAELRRRKERQAKPFALMMLNIASVNEYAELNFATETLLKSWMRPIVLLKRKNNWLPDNITPSLNYLGIMLPYTPLHYLIFHALAGFPQNIDWLEKKKDLVLIVTSANVSGEPLITNDQSANNKLSAIADKVVSYNRDILTRVDDSVLGVIQNTPYFIRRARGFAPSSIKLAKKLPCILGMGGHLKNTICLTRENEAFVSQYLGDMENVEAITFLHETIERMQMLLAIEPEYIAHDKHPDFYTTQFAQSYPKKNFAIQHHHAHLAAVAAEYHIEEPVLGLALDGYGYGADGAAWGGELMQLKGPYYKRLSYLRPLPMPGGEKAIREPWRMAVSALYLLNRENAVTKMPIKANEAEIILQMLKKNINSPFTSSCGRLFDAASALLNIQTHSQYEGQAAMRLESLVTQLEYLPSGFCYEKNQLDLLPLLNYLANCNNTNHGANIFHGTLIEALVKWIVNWSHQTNIKLILLSGGCFLNRILTENLIIRLKNLGLRPLFPKQLPPNDSGISLGQAWITGLLIEAGIEINLMEY